MAWFWSCWNLRLRFDSRVDDLTPEVGYHFILNTHEILLSKISAHLFHGMSMFSCRNSFSLSDACFHVFLSKLDFLVGRIDSVESAVLAWSAGKNFHLACQFPPAGGRA